MMTHACRKPLFLVAVLGALAAGACGGRADTELFSGQPSGSGRGTAPDSTSGSSGSNATSSGSSGSEATCQGLPACDGTDKQVSSESECLQDDAYCYSRTACGVTIWCTGDDACKALPTCPSGYQPIKHCATNIECVDVTMCGQTIHCAKDCAGPPKCDAGDVEVVPSECVGEPECYSKSSCGLTVWCAPAKW